jgi:signal transduction histidine kinase
MSEIIEIPFNVSARTARLIGRENVSNADGAVIELVKNCHDADASSASIFFADNNLYIIDNGHGMDESVIRNVWMNIGTNNKEANPFSSKNRVKAGAKGIGRFALDRLGEKVEMYTLPKDKTSGYRWEIDWSAFEADDAATVGDIKAKLEIIQKLNLYEHLPEINDKRIVEFSNGGTIIKISDLRDEWTLDSLKNLFGSLELLVPIVEEDSFGISVYAKEFPHELGEVKPLLNDDFDYQIGASYDSATHKITATIERNELDLDLIQKRYSHVFDEVTMKEPPFTLSDFQAKKFTKEYDIKEILPGFSDEKNLLEKIGNIKFSFIFAKNSLSKEEGKDIYPYRSVEYASRAEWLGRFSGVRIFRDNFRVRPYGEKGNDWLRLGQRQASSPQGAGQRLGAYRIRPNQISGSVHISRVYNRSLEDKSSREGIQENESYELLKEITLGVIGLVEKDRNVVMFSFRQLWKKNDETEQKKQKGEAAADKVRQAVSGKNGQIDVGVATDLADANDAYKAEVKEKNEEIAVLRGLASAGLVTAAVAHELRGIEKILATRNSDLKKLISKHITESDLVDVRDAFNPFVLLAEMQKTDSNLQDWLKYALMPLKRDRRKTKTVYLNEYFDHLLGTWKNLLSERKIDIEIEKIDDDFSVKMFMIDLDTIFNNMIINSIESFSRKKDKSPRKISITILKKDKYYEIMFMDNGAGLDDSFKKKPEEIFLPQITSKRDGVGNVIGTGMGMYLIKNSVEESRGTVRIAENKNGFTLVVKLPIYSAGQANV